MIDKFVAVLEQKLAEAAAPYQSLLVEGRCGSFDEYRFSAGVIQGLLGASVMAKDLARLAEEDDD